MASTCSRCGASDGRAADDDGLAPGWSLATEGATVRRLCDRCTRAHVRDIEAKLDDAWWD